MLLETVLQTFYCPFIISIPSVALTNVHVSDGWLRHASLLSFNFDDRLDVL